MAWHGDTPGGFEPETTGTEPLEARIATAPAVGAGSGGRVARRRSRPVAHAGTGAVR